MSLCSLTYYVDHEMGDKLEHSIQLATTMCQAALWINTAKLIMRIARQDAKLVANAITGLWASIQPVARTDSDRGE
jgi:hypothetical protein